MLLFPFGSLLHMSVVCVVFGFSTNCCPLCHHNSTKKTFCFKQIKSILTAGDSAYVSTSLDGMDAESRASLQLTNGCL